MFKKYREKRKRRPSTVENFERLTQKIRSVNLGYWGLATHLALWVLLGGSISVSAASTKNSILEEIEFIGTEIWYFAIFGGAIALIFFIYAIGVVPFLFSSVARKRLTNENHTLKNVNNIFVWIDKAIFYGLIIFQISVPIILFVWVLLSNNQG